LYCKINFYSALPHLKETGMSSKAPSARIWSFCCFLWKRVG